MNTGYISCKGSMKINCKKQSPRQDTIKINCKDVRWRQDDMEMHCKANL